MSERLHQTLPREWHTERIVCPECKQVSEATVEHTWPWYSYVHTCPCGYVIIEQEWECADSDMREGGPS